MFLCGNIDLNHLFHRCDVDWPDVKTQRLIDDCENVYEKDNSKTLELNLGLAMIKFQQSYDAAIVSHIILNKWVSRG